MRYQIYTCGCKRTDDSYCSLTPTYKGWGCRFLSTPIDQFPETESEKAKLFARVYREAKQKGITECPHYRSLFIDEVIDSISNQVQN